MNKIQPKAEETLVVVVDPQKGFVDEDGTFAKTFGKEDLGPIQEAIINTDKFISTLPTNVRKMFVRSEYQKNQFSEELPLKCTLGKISINPFLKWFFRNKICSFSISKFLCEISNALCIPTIL